MTSPSSSDDILLDDRLCLALYTASRAMTNRYRQPLVELGLTYPQYLVMVLLWEEGDNPVKYISGRLDLASSTLSPLLKRLEGAGLITRVRDTADERSVMIRLTPLGRAMEERASGVVEEMCAATGLGLAAQSDLVGTLRTLADHLQTSAE